MATRYVYETRRHCNCGREVDAVRIVGEDGLRLSRHRGANRRGFCVYSLTDAPRAKAERRRT